MFRVFSLDCIITPFIRFTCQALCLGDVRFDGSALSTIARFFYGFHIDTISPFFYSAVSQN